MRALLRSVVEAGGALFRRPFDLGDCITRAAEEESRARLQVANTETRTDRATSFLLSDLQMEEQRLRECFGVSFLHARARDEGYYPEHCELCANGQTHHVVALDRWGQRQAALLVTGLEVISWDPRTMKGEPVADMKGVLRGRKSRNSEAALTAFVSIVARNAEEVG